MRSRRVPPPLPPDPIPHVNFFQYPPLQRATSESRRALAQTLELGGFPTAPTFAGFISIPFCVVRCHSCHFFKALGTADLDAYVASVVTEMNTSLASTTYGNIPMGAIYFGGGTASVLSSQHVGALLSSFRELGQVRPETEITLEGSPRELTTSFLQDICSLGVNRVSLGYQSADQAVLDALNSPHRAIEGQKAVEACLGSPLRTFNVDLLFGVPGQTEDQCLNSLRILMDSGVPSIKIYKYVIHPSSPSQRLLDTGKLHLQADTETLHRWYMAARDKLLDAGYVEGRLGSFALPGHRQVYGHIAYDLGYDLLGFGAGAYSFSGGFQFANPWSPHDYIRRVDARDYPIADHVSVQMTKVHEMERFMIFGLMSGIVDAEAFQTRFGISPLSAFPLEFNQLCDARLIERDSSHIRLTEHGRAWKAHVLYHFYREHPPEADHEI